MEIDLKPLAGRILDELKSDLGDAWSQFKADEKSLVIRCAERAAAYTLHEVATGKKNDRNWKQIAAQLANITSAAELQLQRHFFNALSRVFGVAKLFLGGLFTSLAA